MKRTRMKLETLPGSRVNSFTLTRLLGFWGKIAEMVEKLLLSKSYPTDKILWELVYWIGEVEEEDESCTPQPFMTARVSLGDCNLGIPLRYCLNDIEFNVYGVVFKKEDKTIVSKETEVASLIAKSLRK